LLLCHTSAFLCGVTLTLTFGGGHAVTAATFVKLRALCCAVQVRARAMVNKMMASQRGVLAEGDDTKP
jgi:hypothetical protein